VTALFIVYDSVSAAGQCAGCYDATGGPCGRICAGANHGAGRRLAIRNTFGHARERLDRAAEANPSILAADIPPRCASVTPVLPRPAASFPRAQQQAGAFSSPQQGPGGQYR
jgi:hypothetical protein